MGAIDLSRYLWPSIAEGRQPQHLVKIDRDNPLGAKVVYASTLAGVAVDLATGKTGVNTAAVPKASPRGMALNFNGSSAYITLPKTNLVAAYPLTVSCWFERPATTSGGVLYSLNGASYSAIGGFYNLNGGNFITNTGSNPAPTGYPHSNFLAGWNHIVVIHRSGSWDLYVNGVGPVTLTVANNWGQPSAGNHSIGNRLNGASPQYFNGGGIQDFIVFQGELSADEAKQVYLDPYQIFSTPEPIWLGAAVGAPTIVPLGQVTETESAQAISVNPQRRLLGQAVETDTAQSITRAAVGHTVSLAQAVETDSAQAVATNPQRRLLGQAVETDTAQTITSLAILSPADRGTLDLSNCSITPNGLTPQINLKNRYIGDANATGARFTFGRITGVNGMTPVFKVDRSNMEIDSSAKFLWSPTGLLGSWTPFTNTTKDANFYTFSHGSVFTSDTIYFASNNPWPVSYTLPWIQSLEASGFVFYAPSGGTSYQFETRIATTNGATAGTGDVIPAQPLFSFKISSGGANAPDGNPKRALILSAGVHAAEDVGNYALKGAVDFLVGADAQAVTVRNWFNIFVYPMVSSAGRAGGGQRNDFENAAKTSDVNRQWLSTTHETVVKHKTAFTADVGATVKFFVDFHGTPSTNESEYHYVYGPNQAKWTNAIRVYRPGFEIRAGTTADSLPGWMQSGKAASYALTAEYQFHATQNLASVATYGADVLRAVAYLATAGEFAQIGQVVETDAAQAITPIGNKIVPLAQVTESDTAQAITVNPKRRLVARAIETDTAQLITARKTAALLQVVETDTAQAITPLGAKIVPLAQATETDTTQAITVNPKRRLVAQVSETDTAQAISAPKRVLLGQATESNTAGAISLLGQTIAKPSSDVLAGAWLPSVGSTLYGAIDEVSADASDYIYTSSASICSLGLSPAVDPLTSTGQVVRYQAWSPLGNGLTVRLKQGATVIASWTHTVLPLTPTIWSQPLSAAECDAITDYTALRLDLESL